jgi:hypothetical protein
MKLKMIVSGLLAGGLSCLTASACLIQIRVTCPNDRPGVGVEICLDGSNCAVTDDQGIAVFGVPDIGTYVATVTESTLPPGATVNPNKVTIKAVTDSTTYVDIFLSGDFCSTPPPPGPCWLTGGGTIGKTRGPNGQPNYSFGGVVYPGCSPKAADGGNWNVIDHATGLHFQGQHIVVDSCSGIATKSPRVKVNIIDFHGEGIIDGIAGNPEGLIPVTFVGRAVDNLESGGGNDTLFLQVLDGSTVMMQVGNSATAPAVITTGNLQIHTTGCNQ